jgi:hypothetical protein
MKKYLFVLSLLLPISSFAESGGFQYTDGSAKLNSGKSISGFVGGNVGYSSVTWSQDVADAYDAVYDAELSPLNLALGAEAGIKFGSPNKIWNGGVAIAYDYMFDAAAKIGSLGAPYVSEITTGFSFVSATFDNYIRVAGGNLRTDLVLGIGFANGTERAAITPTALGAALGIVKESASDDGSFVVLKFGVSQQLSDSFDLTAGLRIFAPTADGDIDGFGAVNIGARFTF